MENPIKMDDLGEKPTIFGNIFNKPFLFDAPGFNPNHLSFPSSSVVRGYELELQALGSSWWKTSN